MDSLEIRKFCINSAKVYYDYLDQNNKGIYSIRILNITPVGDGKFKLKIHGRIFDEETLVFKNHSSNNQWDISSIQIKIYDRDKNILIIKPLIKEVVELLSNSSPNDWVIISDLKFLVKRVENWYELNGSRLKIPTKTPTIAPPDKELFFKDLPLPSEQQIEAINLIFSTPFSYIWGAPGTGKTQYVLSYAILNYLKSKKKIAIIAPTNYALEQIFRGVIKMTDKANIKRGDILRLGGPSKKFADDFPEVCELIGIEKELKKINEQINVLRSILGIDNSSYKLKAIEVLFNKIENQENIVEKIASLEDKSMKQSNNINDFQKKKYEFNLRINVLKQEQDYLIKKKNSLFTSIISVFHKKFNYEDEINNCIVKEAKLTSEKKEIQNKLYQTENEKKETCNEIQQQNRELEKEEFEINVVLKQLGEIQLKHISRNNQIELKNELNRITEKLKEIYPLYESLAQEYSNNTRFELEDKLEKLLKDKEKLEGYSTEERMKNVAIIGATLDTYLYRFLEVKLNVDHIFLDEAGYSNIIKAQTLLNQDVPVTFLGDHKQLPPVCEISKQDIQNNNLYQNVLVWDQPSIYIEDIYDYEDSTEILNSYLNNAKPTFEKLKKSNLSITHRFGKNVSRVLQEFVYTEGFNSSLETETKIIIYNVHNPIHLRNGERINQSEALAITEILKNKFKPENSVAVLTPYNAQARKLMGLLPEYKDENKIMTVHQSQGQEWDTVIYSVSDLGNGRTPWFTDSQNKLSNGLNNINTAISRAKKELIIVCDYNAWLNKKDQLISGILNNASEVVNPINIIEGKSN